MDKPLGYVPNLNHCRLCTSMHVSNMHIACLDSRRAYQRLVAKGISIFVVPTGIPASASATGPKDAKMGQQGTTTSDRHLPRRNPSAAVNLVGRLRGRAEARESPLDPCDAGRQSDRGLRRTGDCPRGGRAAGTTAATGASAPSSCKLFCTEMLDRVVPPCHRGSVRPGRPTPGPR